MAQRYFVYILRSLRNGKLYVGHTENVERRVKQHNQGQGGKFTREQGPWKLVYNEEQADRSKAIARERYLKSIEGFQEKKQLAGQG